MSDAIGSFGRVGDVWTGDMSGLVKISGHDPDSDAKIDKAIDDSGAPKIIGATCAAAIGPEAGPLCETATRLSMTSFVKFFGVDLGSGEAHQTFNIPKELYGLPDPHTLPGFTADASAASPAVQARTKDLHDAFGRVWAWTWSGDNGGSAHTFLYSLGTDREAWDDQVFIPWQHGGPLCANIIWNIDAIGRFSMACFTPENPGGLPAYGPTGGRPTVDDAIWSWAYLRAQAEILAETQGDPPAQIQDPTISQTPPQADQGPGTDASPPNRHVVAKAIAVVGGAAAIYSAVQFARKKPNVIVDQAKRVYAKIRR